jgi:hypothetical protein
MHGVLRRFFNAKSAPVTDTVPEDTTGPGPHDIEDSRRRMDTNYGFYTALPYQTCCYMKRIDEFHRRKAPQTSSRCGWPGPLASKLPGPSLCMEFRTIGSTQLIDDYKPARLDAGCVSFLSFLSCGPRDRQIAQGNISKRLFLRGHILHHGKRDTDVERP